MFLFDNLENTKYYRRILVSGDNPSKNPSIRIPVSGDNPSSQCPFLCPRLPLMNHSQDGQQEAPKANTQLGYPD
jgi:hypothetical protein